MAFLTKPGALLISEGLAAENGLALGDPVMLDAGGRQSTGFVAGLLHPGDALSRRALDGLILADLATAQEITGRIGRLDTIDLILPRGDLTDLREPVRSLLLPPDAQIVPVRLRSGALAQMTAAFRTNLTALSLLALVVGMFLIYNSMTFSVVQRRPLFGTLRCLGVTRGEIGALVLGEAVMVGALGSLLGLGLGVILGQGAVQAVTQTINDLYFVVTVRGIAIPVAEPRKRCGGRGVRNGGRGRAAGMGGDDRLAAPGAHPVRPGGNGAAAGAVDGARRAYRDCSWRRAAGVLQQSSASSGQSLAVSFAGIFFLTIGFALLAPVFTLIFSRLAVAPAQAVFGVLGRMAPRSVTGALSRTAVAVAALMVAVSVTIGVGLMVGSFRTTVVSWLGQTLWGDLYVSAPSLTATRSIRPARSAGDRCRERVARRAAVGCAALGGCCIAGRAGGRFSGVG